MRNDETRLRQILDLCESMTGLVRIVIEQAGHLAEAGRDEASAEMPAGAGHGPALGLA